jgi:hypothetical protein
VLRSPRSGSPIENRVDEEEESVDRWGTKKRRHPELLTAPEPARLIPVREPPGVPARGPIAWQHHDDPIEFANEE